MGQLSIQCGYKRDLDHGDSALADTGTASSFAACLTSAVNDQNVRSGLFVFSIVVHASPKGFPLTSSTLILQHCFEAVTSIIYCVALSEYDQVLLEENGQVRRARCSL